MFRRELEFFKCCGGGQYFAVAQKPWFIWGACPGKEEPCQYCGLEIKLFVFETA